jgi:hypothetical protein
MFRVGTRRAEGQHLVPIKHVLRAKHQSDDACYAVSVNLIIPINYYSDTPCLGKIYCGKVLQNFLSMRSSLLESVTVTEFQATEAYSISDLTKAK